MMINNTHRYLLTSYQYINKKTMSIKYFNI